jgi:hypothetical protein
MSSLPTWALPYAAENILYTRTFLAANSEVLQNDGFMNLTSSGSTPLIYPQDFTSSVAVNSTGATSTATLPSVTSSVSSSVSASSGPYPSASSLGSSSSASAAISTSSSKILLGLVVGFATFMIF